MVTLGKKMILKKAREITSGLALLSDLRVCTEAADP